MDEIARIEAVLHDISEYVVDRYSQRDTLTVSTKASPTDFLTEVDIAVQRRIVEHLSAAYPSDILIAEESGLDSFKGSPPSRCWMIDPIDGTQNFLRGLFPEFGVSIGFLVDGNAVAGGVLFPVSQDLFLSQYGSGAFRNGKRMQVSQIESLQEARVDIDFGALSYRNQYRNHAQGLLEVVGQVRSYGCSVMGFCQVADGQQDAYIPFNVKPWDVAAGILLVEEAGGKVTSFEGESVTPFLSEKIGIVSNLPLHSQCVDLLGGLSKG
ncbi:inositol monophosphatase family protein [Sphaerochaeta sp. S2]|uniref:inositol monophosphatase family protein n=1 Tax=Sphaerochaeta sp. S2 TaxID=2798868 RepID=UPI0018E92FF0|nr:inositol monophosphatase family protein [Sphaerochaeta sp. S2]MBJ2357826.1 inositol monophosphatase [Sphaerochaeta sp. S2]